MDDIDLNNNQDELDWVDLELTNMDEWVDIDPNLDAILFK